MDDCVNIEPDFLISGYKIVTNIDMTNITIIEDQSGEPVCEWIYTQIAWPMKENIQPPWEIFPFVTETFHYYPMRGILKMDIILQNFKSENVSSCIFLSYGVRFTSSEHGNSTTVVFDHQEISYNEIEKAYSTNSTLIKFKVNGIEKGFFDFGRNVTIDGKPNIKINGSVGPTRSSYYYQTGGLWLEIGLNYPHVNQTLTHDPCFGLSISDDAIQEFPSTVMLTSLTIILTMTTLKLLIKLIRNRKQKYVQSSLSHR
ncbi:MAG: hypothetical protein QXH91_00920 [Candidatus Bathyarchaeia archaeon]